MLGHSVIAMRPSPTSYSQMLSIDALLKLIAKNMHLYTITVQKIKEIQSNLKLHIYASKNLYSAKIVK